MRWGYNNVRIKEGDEWKAAFKTSDGLFEPTVMFFGLTNSPATFQTMVDDELMEFIDRGEGSVYMDDIVIHTEGTEEEHEAIVHKWLAKLETLSLFLKPSKCEFHKCEVEYLGMVVGNGSVRMDPVKVQGITAWPTPSCIKDVRSFLGFCNFYRAFILDFSNIARPLNDLTCKNYQWDWSEACKAAFQWLKDVCTSEPVLKTPDWTKPFVMHTDASSYALGVVIVQEHDDGMHPIAFHSRSLLPAERNYDVHDRELAGIVFGFKCGPPSSSGLSTPSASSPTTRTYSTSVNRRKSQADRPDGSNSSRISIIPWSTSPELRTPSLTSCLVARTLTRGWILIFRAFRFPIIFFPPLPPRLPSQQTKSSLLMTSRHGAKSSDPYMTRQ